MTASSVPAFRQCVLSRCGCSSDMTNLAVAVRAIILSASARENWTGSRRSVARRSTGVAGALGVRVRRLQYLVAMYAARSRTSASGMDRSNVAPCTFITTLPADGGSLSVLSLAAGAVLLQAGRGCSCPVLFVGGVEAGFVGCAWTGVLGCFIAMLAPTRG